MQQPPSTRLADGSAGDADYAVIGPIYTRYRQPDPRIAARIAAALGDARTVLNVGAGTGSYEPTDRLLTPVEPSATMRARRPPHLPPAIDAVAERLPFADRSFDASMTVFSVHQWPNLAAGLREMRRVTAGPVLVLTCDPAALHRFWLHRYAPEVIAVEARRYPPVASIAALLGPRTQVIPIPIPLDCTDGFQEAYYGRPEGFLDPQARRACSAWSFVPRAVTDRLETQLAADLRSGAWDAAYGHLRTQPHFDGSLRLIAGRL
jgi:SAM-dependent methyltransferase